METHKIIYFEYGGRTNCHYNPQQDNLTPEEFINKLKVFRKGDNIR
ncbi:1332_t:CDS:1, partial [Ambispora gerdemannii]